MPGSSGGLLPGQLGNSVWRWVGHQRCQGGVHAAELWWGCEGIQQLLLQLWYRPYTDGQRPLQWKWATHYSVPTQWLGKTQLWPPWGCWRRVHRYVTSLVIQESTNNHFYITLSKVPCFFISLFTMIKTSLPLSKLWDEFRCSANTKVLQKLPLVYNSLNLYNYRCILHRDFF